VARRLRVSFQGAIYHVTSRGNARQLVFLDDGDRRRFLARLEKVAADYEVRVFLFCLMPNHVHLLVETPHGNLSEFMGNLLTSYSVYFNLRHRRVGHVTQGRFGAQVVEGDEYLRRLSRYIHLNPVFAQVWRERMLAERVAALRAYPWSSYPDYVGLMAPRPYVVCEPILGATTGATSGAAEQYRAYVESGLATTDDELQALLRRRPLALGSESFCRRVGERYADLVTISGKPEDAALRRPVASLGPETVLGVTSAVLRIAPLEFQRPHANALARATAARMLCRYGQATRRDAAAHLGLGTGAAITYQLKVLERELGRRPALARQVAEIEQRLEALRAGRAAAI
jgi:REP element-mobilizing transposase RayT